MLKKLWSAPKTWTALCSAVSLPAPRVRVDVGLTLEVGDVAVAVGEEDDGGYVGRRVLAEDGRSDVDDARGWFQRTGGTVPAAGGEAVQGGPVDALAAPRVPDQQDPAQVGRAEPPGPRPEPPSERSSTSTTAARA